MKPTCPPSQRLAPPHAAPDQASQRDPAPAETCLPTNSSVGEIVKSVGTGAEIGFSQGDPCYTIEVRKNTQRKAKIAVLFFSFLQEWRLNKLTSGQVNKNSLLNVVDSFHTFGNVKLWEKTDLPTNSQIPKPYASGRRGL